MEEKLGEEEGLLVPDDPFEEASAEGGFVRIYDEYTANDYRKMMKDSNNPIVRRVWKDLPDSYKDPKKRVGKKVFVDAVNKKLAKTQFGEGKPAPN